jgi:hypothetical protein
MTATALAYALVVIVGHPDYLARVLPVAASLYDGRNSDALLAMATGHFLPVILATLVAAWWVAPREAALAQILILAGAGALVAAVSQGKGWDYHFVAARGAASAALATALAARIDARPAAAVAATLLGLALACQTLTPPFKAQQEYRFLLTKRMTDLIRREAAGRPVLWLTTGIHPQFPALNDAGSRMAMPFMSLWILPAIYGPTARPGEPIALNPPDRMDARERLLFDGVVRGFTEQRPALLVVEDASREGGFRGGRLDYIAYFSQSPSFAAALTHYRPHAKDGTLSIWKKQQ